MKNKKIILMCCLVILILGIVGLLFLRRPTELPPTSSVPREERSPILPCGEYMWPSALSYETAIRSLGFSEIFIAHNNHNAISEIASIPHKLIIKEDMFELQFSYQTWQMDSNKYKEVSGWTMFGTKADGCKNISSIDPQLFQHTEEENILDSEFQKIKAYLFFNDPADTEFDMVTVCYAIYYPKTRHLYNIVNTCVDISMPEILVTTQEEFTYMQTQNSVFVYQDGYPIEYAELNIQTGQEQKTYQYRVGMTVNTWAASGLANGDWFIGLGDVAYSSDYQYVIPSIDHDIRLLLDENNTLAAIPVSEYTQFAADTKMMFENSSMFTTIAHILNTETPIILDGIKIENDYTVYPGYTTFGHAFVFDTRDTVSVSLRHIEDEWLEDMSLYVFKEPIENRELWEEDSLNKHRAPAQDQSYLQIPADARAIPFERLLSDEELPSDEYYSFTDEKVAIATFTIDQEPNYSPINSNVFAITYKGIIVYWVHVPIYSENTNIFDFSKIEIIFMPDNTFILKSDFYTPEQLEEAKVMLENDETWYNDMLARFEEAEVPPDAEFIEGEYPEFAPEP